jgi:pimeloyl-ACP methyl ester carboxylesterase
MPTYIGQCLSLTAPAPWSLQGHPLCIRLLRVSAQGVRRFRIAIPEQQLVDLRRRLAETRWPEPETVQDWSQGVPLHELQALCGHWLTEYDWRATERRLNRWPQYQTEIDGLNIHYFHLPSATPEAVPLILTHGWPGSFFEFEQAMEQLAGSTAPGGGDFHLVVPSLPGYGFSGRPSSAGWGVHRIARAWAALMQRLGYHRFIAAGSDWGTSISTSLALQHEDRLLGLHLVPPLVPPLPVDGQPPTEQELAAAQQLRERSRTGSGYSAMQGTRPQTIGYSLVDSPAGLCAWIFEKLWTWSDHAGDLFEVLDREQVLDNITLYWLTGAGASSARLYWESIDEISAWFTNSAGDRIDVPTGCTVFPWELPRPSRRLAERRFSNIVHWGEPPRGGHFGAWEQPALFVQEIRAVCRALTHPKG